MSVLKLAPAALAVAAVLLSAPVQAGGWYKPDNALNFFEVIKDVKNALKDGYHYKHGKLVKKTEQSTGYSIRYRSPNNPMEDNLCWTQQKLAFHQYVAGTCVYDPDMYKSLIDEAQPSTNCTKSTIDYDKVGKWWFTKQTSSSTSSGNCPTYQHHHYPPAP